MIATTLSNAYFASPSFCTSFAKIRHGVAAGLRMSNSSVLALELGKYKRSWDE